MSWLLDLLRKKFEEGNTSGEQFDIETELTVEVYGKDGKLKCKKIIR